MSILYSDLDGTLVDTMPQFYEIMQQCMAKLGIEPLSLSMLRDQTIETTMQKITFEEAMLRHINDHATLVEFFKMVWQEFEVFTKDKSQLFPGTYETLSDLKAKGWTIIIYTGRDQPRDSLQIELERFGINDLITDVFTVHTYNQAPANNHPKETMLHEIFEHYNGYEDQRWLISDLPDDMLFTRDTNVNGIGVLTGVGNENSFQCIGVPYISSFTAFPQFVDSVLRG